MTFVGPPLKRMMNELGRNVLADMCASPTLTAAIDQHAAAVRDAVASDGKSPIDRERLVDYLLGVMDFTHGESWADTQFRAPYSWPTLRVAAICWIAQEQGYVH